MNPIAAPGFGVHVLEDFLSVATFIDKSHINADIKTATGHNIVHVWQQQYIRLCTKGQSLTACSLQL